MGSLPAAIKRKVYILGFVTNNMETKRYNEIKKMVRRDLSDMYRLSDEERDDYTRMHRNEIEQMRNKK